MDQSGPARKQSLPLPLATGRRLQAPYVFGHEIDRGCRCYTYEAKADPEKTTICHCTDCQHLSGPRFAPSSGVADSKSSLGEPIIYVNTADSCARRVRGFCSRCGTPIYSTAEGDGPKYVLHPWDCARTCCARADLVSLATALGDRLASVRSLRKAVNRGAS
jgi:hypothetical protein